MINKLYDNIKKIIKNNYKSLVFIFVVTFVCLIRFPFYINAPGGIINIDNRIKITESSKNKGSYNLTYVSEIPVNISLYLVSLFKPSWEIVAKDDVIGKNETIEEVDFRGKKMLEESLSNAVIVAYNEALKPVEITNRNTFIVYVLEDSMSDLKIGDEILEVNNTKISNQNEINQIIDSYNVGDEITFKVKNNDKYHNRTAKIYNIENKNIVGVILSETKTYNTNPKIEFESRKSEFGPSGGLITALAIYDKLINKDLTNGLKIAGTGTISEDGSVGSIGGVTFKLKGAIKKNADVFFVPDGENYNDATKLKRDKKYEIEIVPIANFSDAINYLENYEN